MGINFQLETLGNYAFIQGGYAYIAKTKLVRYKYSGFRELGVGGWELGV